MRDALGERHEVIPVEAAEGAFDALRRARPDIVFNIAEGATAPAGKGTSPPCWSTWGFPYTASDPLTLNICLDKARTKEILAYHGLPTARFRVVAEKNFSFNSLHYPLMVKPLYEGSSIGIRDNSLVRTRQEMRERVIWLLDRYREPALVEEYLPGREFTVAILGNGEEARVLPIVEIKFDSLPPGVNPDLLLRGQVDLGRRAPVRWRSSNARRGWTDGLQRGNRALCLQAYRVLRCRDWCRIDVRLDAAGPAAHPGAESAAGDPSQAGAELLFSESGSGGRDELQPADQRGSGHSVQAIRDRVMASTTASFCTMPPTSPQFEGSEEKIYPANVLREEVGAIEESLRAAGFSPSVLAVDHFSTRAGADAGAARAQVRLQPVRGNQRQHANWRCAWRACWT